METDNNEGFNIHEAADEIIASESDSQSTPDDSSQSEGQPENTDSQETDEVKELSAEEILNQVANEKENPEQFADLLKMVNGLGAIHHGTPINVESPEKLKQLLEMGAGFYQKTEAHANEVKAKEAEFLQKENAFKEREQKLAQEEQAFSQGREFHSIMSEILADMQSSDPELFAHLDGLVMAHQKRSAATLPLKKEFEAKLGEYDAKFKSLEQQKQGEELKGIKQNWEKELSDVQSKSAASLAKLGVVIDWNKVKETWTADASNKMTVEQALYAAYGADIQKAHTSYNKLLETKHKTSSKLLGRTGIGNGRGKEAETIVASRAGDYGSILRQASQTM